MPPSYLSDALSLATILLRILGLSQSVQANGKDAFGLFHFVSRPDLKAPKWNIEVYDEDVLCPGYWFLAPHKALRQLKEAGDDGWIGPTICNQDGELNRNRRQYWTETFIF